MVTFDEVLAVVKEWPEYRHSYDPWIDFEEVVFDDGLGAIHGTYYGWTAMLAVEDDGNVLIMDARVNTPWEGWSDIEVPELYVDPGIKDSMDEFARRMRILFKERGWVLDRVDNLYDKEK